MPFLKRFQSILESLHSLSENSKYVIAYSGGVDSHVLLYCCAKLKLPVRAVHVHHGLQSIADEWSDHCQHICAQLEVPIDVLTVDARQKKGQSPEESARNARYSELSNNLRDGDCLVTAQHQNDQAETLLLQLFRTASAAGLSAMPEKKQFGSHMHIRPLLSFSRQEIEAFAIEHGLLWVEDPSNQDVTFDRNYVRKNIVPLLEDRWSGIYRRLSTVAKLQSDNLQVMEDMAAIDLANVVKQPVFRSKLSVYEVISVLSIAALQQLSSERLFNLLRYWILREIKISPTRNLLQEIEKTIINAQQDANPVITYSGFEYRKYNNELYLLKMKSDPDENCDVDWRPATPLLLPASNIRLTAVNSTGTGLKLELMKKPLRICFRKGGEYFHPVQRKHSQSLKKLLQEEGVPPWERGSFPLLYFNDELIAVIGLWISKQYAVDKNEDGWVVDVEVL